VLRKTLVVLLAVIVWGILPSLTPQVKASFYEPNNQILRLPLIVTDNVYIRPHRYIVFYITESGDLYEPGSRKVHDTDVRSINFSVDRNGSHTIFYLKNDNTLWGWGANRSGQLGDGTDNNRTTPVKIMDDVARV
jgi:hypothetical protein